MRAAKRKALGAALAALLGPWALAAPPAEAAIPREHASASQALVSRERVTYERALSLLAPAPEPQRFRLFDHLPAAASARALAAELAHAALETRLGAIDFGRIRQLQASQRFSLENVVGEHEGRFISADPMGYVDGPNDVQAFLNDPINGSDPMGLCLGIDNLPCGEWYALWLQTQAQASAQVASGVVTGLVNLGSYGGVDSTEAALEAFSANRGTLSQKAEAARLAANAARTNYMTLGFAGEKDKLAHAQDVFNGALGTDAQHRGSIAAFEACYLHPDAEACLLGAAQWMGGASQTVLTLATAGEGAQTLAKLRPRGVLVPKVVPRGRAHPGAFERTETLSGRASARRVSEIEASMREHGFTGEPIKVVESGGRRYVLDGHHRLEAARRAGIPVEYEVVSPTDLPAFGYQSLDEVTRAADNAAPNRLRR